MDKVCDFEIPCATDTNVEEQAWSSSNSSSQYLSSEDSSKSSSSNHSEWSNLSDYTCDEGVAAFRSALEAEIAGGLDTEFAVCALFGKHKDDPIVSPIISALNTNDQLHNDLNALASLCHAVYTLTEKKGDETHDVSLEHFREKCVKTGASGVPRPYAPSDDKLPIASIRLVASAIAKATNIVVLVGAGVSVSCGIPDFRSEGGLYDLVRRVPNFDLGDAQVVFDLNEFHSNPEIFFRIAKHLMPSSSTMPSQTHKFIATLQARKKLRRVYSQNIDGLEQKAGISLDKLVLCHGSFLSATCTHASCNTSVPASCIEKDVQEGVVSYCKQCINRQKTRSRRRTKRRQHQKNLGKSKRNAWVSDSENDTDAENDTVGVMKPDIVFFGESLPSRVKHCLELDVPHADLVLVFGTSLLVKPVSLIPNMFHPSVPQFLINRQSVSHSFHAELLGDCDTSSDALCRYLNWSLPSSSTSPPTLSLTHDLAPSELKFSPEKVL